jgi:hypothetical protein
MSGRRVAANSDVFGGVPAMLCHLPAETTHQGRQRVCQQCAEAVETRWRFSPFARAAASPVAQEDYPEGRPEHAEAVSKWYSIYYRHWQTLAITES